jgi:enoyl-CoA hydratase
VRVLTLRAQSLDPEKALAMGVVDELAAPDRLLDRAIALAEELAALPRVAYARVKHQVRAETIERTRAAAATDHDPMLDVWLGSDATAAAAAALRDRTPGAS